MPFEDDIRAALRRDQPPSDFASKVLAKVEREAKVVEFPVWRQRAKWAIAAGVLLAALTPAAIMDYRHRQEERAIDARKQLFVALRITRVKLQQAKERVHHATSLDRKDGRHAI